MFLFFRNLSQCLCHLCSVSVPYSSVTPTPGSFPNPQMLVGIRVLDINDNDPVLLNLPMNVTISENSPVSSFVAHILASDADSGCNALLTFNITAGNRERAFFINATVGSDLPRAPGSSYRRPIEELWVLDWSRDFFVAVKKLDPPKHEKPQF